jgi:hypothetical protein
MINGFFIMTFSKLPISQLYKSTLIFLLFVRMSARKEFQPLLILFVSLQIGAFSGWIKTGSVGNLVKDISFGAQWFIIPLTFFYFKGLLKTAEGSAWVEHKLKGVIKKSYTFMVINMILGAAGFGMAFYNHGYGNAIGTKGFIYAGNELTFMLLLLSFIIAIWTWREKQFKAYIGTFLCSFTIAFLLTSKTSIAGVLLVYAFPLLAEVKIRLKKKWLVLSAILIPLLIPVLYKVITFGIQKVGLVDKIKDSFERNNGEILTVILSNRNKFVARGWEVYWDDFSIFGKLFGFGQQYHINVSGIFAEIDLASLLFASGFSSFILYVFFLTFMLMNVFSLRKLEAYVYAKPVTYLLVFLIVVGNLSGHVFDAGIAGFFVATGLSLMFFYKPSNSPL